MTHWLPLVVMLPLVGGALAPVLARPGIAFARAWSLAIVAVTALGALLLTLEVAARGPFSYPLGGWGAPYGIELRFDEFSAAILFIVLVAGLALVYSGRYAAQALQAERLPWFYALLLLNLGGMIGFAVTGDLFNLFVFMEVVSVSSYALVALGDTRLAPLAAFRYLLAGAVSSALILFSIGILYALTGSLNMADVAVRLGGQPAGMPATLALGGLVAGFLLKAALFPLHAWLPDAHASAPSPVSAILSGLVVKLGVLGLLRSWQLFAAAGVVPLAALGELLAWGGALSIIAGAAFALFQQDIKRMLAYSTVSNVGYIIMGFGLATQQAVMGASLHVLNHALIKSTLFLAAGALIHQTGCRTLYELRGAGRAMPLTSLALTVGVLSVVGLPPTAGFPGKWYIALGALQADRPGFAVVAAAGGLLAFAYYMRVLNALYFWPPTHERVLGVREAPASMLAPVLLLALLCLFAGIFARIPLTFLEPAVARLVGT
jgi:multicomponent Na+:H+ antiporter subunit D